MANNKTRTAADILRRIRANRPVVHSITNYVVMNSTANVLLAMGASPIMAHAPEEMEELVKIAGCVVINIGTLSRPWIGTMVSTARICAQTGTPYVLDPVGAGATKLRTDTARDLIKAAKPKTIRGNASEILSISPAGGTTRGVDSMNDVNDAVDAAAEVAGSLETVVAVTGERDLVTDGNHSLIITGGHQLMSSVTGTGCAASVIVGAFLAVEEDPLIAAAAGSGFLRAGRRKGCG